MSLDPDHIPRTCEWSLKLNPLHFYGNDDHISGFLEVCPVCVVNRWEVKSIRIVDL